MSCLPHLTESPLGRQEQLGKRKNLVNDQEEFASAAWGSRVCRQNFFQSKENSNKSFEVTFVTKFLCLYAYFSVILIDRFLFFLYTNSARFTLTSVTVIWQDIHRFDEDSEGKGQNLCDFIGTALWPRSFSSFDFTHM